VSLGINIDKVTRVLLPDGWHDVDPFDDGRSSLVTDAYELVEYGRDGSPEHWVQPKAECTGIGFIDAGTKRRICAPLTAVLATEEEP
jgi:hypothetical protein